MDTPGPVAVVTDSAAGIPSSLLEEYRIGVVPFHVRVGDRWFTDGVDIDPSTFFRMVRAEENVEVATGVPSTEVFVEIYERLAEWAKGIVSIHVAGHQSGTCSAAQLAAQESPVPVEVVDSETTAMAQGFVVLEAARAALEGSTLSEVVERARSMVPHVEVVALLETVEHAIKGGRLASGARLLGALLRIQPLVRVAENKVSLVGQVRRRRSGLNNLIERVTSRVADRPTHLTIHYAEDEGEGNRLLETLREKINCVEHYLTHIPVALGVHAGPGSIGVAYYVEGGPVEQESLVDRLRTRLPGGD